MRLVLPMLAGAALVAPVAAQSAPPPLPSALAGQAAGAQWTTYNGVADETRFSGLDTINAGNAGGLGLAWSYDIATPRGQESTPLVVGGTMYVTTSWSNVVALDAVTGRVLWTHDAKVPGTAAVHACCDVVNRGAAYDRGRLFVATLDGRLQALDARTGRLVWSVMTVDPAKPYSISGAPRVARGKVYIGNSGAEFGVRGYASAYDEATGKLAWRFYTVPGEPGKKDGAASDAILEKLARPTWFGDRYWRFGGGGTVWDSIVYDEALHRIYLGVGNGGPWNRKLRSDDKGDNLFLGSIVALDADTGRYLWHYQETPGDTWDFTSSQQIVLTTMRIGGADRKVILHAPKNGFFYVIDRESGKLLSAEKFADVNWAERVDMATGRPVENPDARFQQKPFLASSGALGAHNWQPMAFSPKTGLVYIPAQQVPFLYTKDDHFVYRPGLWAIGVDIMNSPVPKTPEAIAAMQASLKGWLSAWDPVAQKERWRVPHASSWNGGVLATAGNLVFQGLSDSTFRAWTADTGRELWKFDVRSPVLAGAMTYAVRGRQYVAVVVGNGGAPLLSMPVVTGPTTQAPGRVLVFALGGKGTLPVTEQVRAPLNPASESWTPEALAHGRQTYNAICAGCHGLGAMSAGVVPDLRRSGALADRATWQRIVIGGALSAQGMVSFAKYLTPEQADEVRGFVSAQAREAQASENKASEKPHS